MSLDDILNELGTNIVTEAKQILQQKKKVASGNLLKSIKYELKDSQLFFLMEDYGFYIDSGRNSIDNPIPDRKAPRGLPKLIETDSLQDWFEKRGIDEKYFYVISMAIKKKGFKGGPTYFFTDPYETNMSNLDSMIDNMLDDSLGNIIDMI